MSKIIKTVQFGANELRIETGEMARQASGSVFIGMNGTQVLVTVVGVKESSEKNDFFPLTVNYQEKKSAIGKVPGGYNKREGRPSDDETLISRLIDRPLRPLFPEGFSSQVQVVATTLSYNPEVPADILAMIGASAALAISGIPFEGPMAAVRVGYHQGIYLPNPGKTAMKDSSLDLVVAGTMDSILMVESEAEELSEAIMLGAVLYGHEILKSVIVAIEELAQEVGKPSWNWVAPAINAPLESLVHELMDAPLAEAYQIKDKLARHQELAQIKDGVLKQMGADHPQYSVHEIKVQIDKIERALVRQRILDKEPRIDGRDLTTVRPISIRTGFLERTHGSVLFTRGETQAVVTATLGSDRDAQIIEKLDGEVRERFMLHYNFPPYSVGEVGMVGSPKRREIGHGKLAHRGLVAVLPEHAVFPYVLRVVSDITESNGSSSMATVCGASLALMDAGVPLKAPVAGVAMGLIKEGTQYAILTDILGDEDHLGDMDFKVAGTERGITALQMDIKINGITQGIMEQALDQALAGRLHILSVMNDSLAEHRSDLSNHAPRIVTMKVPEDKIRTIIGKGGVTIKGLIESTGASIDIDDTGTVQLFSPNLEALDEAQRQIKLLIADIEVGQTYHGRVNKIVEFGAFINLLPGKDGLLHVSQICSERSQKVEEVLTEGQEIDVYVAGIDKQGRVKLEWQKNAADSSSQSDLAIPPKEQEDLVELTEAINAGEAAD